MAASRLVGKERRQAIVWGVIGAIALRVTFTAMFALLLGVPLLQLVGGLMLVWIAYKLVRPSESGHGDVKAASGRLDAIRTIVMADVVMSLDNILAVGGAAHGEIELLLSGLALSMPLITFGSGFVAWSLARLPVLLLAGAGVLAKGAGEMIGHDPYTRGFVHGVPSLAFLERPVASFPSLAWLPLFGEATLLSFLLQLGLVVLVVAAGVLMRRGSGNLPDVEAPVREDAGHGRDFDGQPYGEPRRARRPGPDQAAAPEDASDAASRGATRSG